MTVYRSTVLRPSVRRVLVYNPSRARARGHSWLKWFCFRSGKGKAKGFGTCRGTRSHFSVYQMDLRTKTDLRSPLLLLPISPLRLPYRITPNEGLSSLDA